MKSVLRRATLVLGLSGLLIACSSGSEEGSSDSAADSASTFAVSGRVGAVSLTNAEVGLFDAQGVNVTTVTSNSGAAFSIEIPGDSPMPLTLLANDGEDLISGGPAAFEMMAMVPSDEFKTIHISPLSTLAAQIEDCAEVGELTASELLARARQNFSLGLSVQIDPLHDPVVVSNAVQLTLANEALTEIVRRSHLALSSAGMQVTTSDILRQVGCDLAIDGLLNGTGLGVEARLITTVRAAEMSVGMELIAGRLHIGGQDASTWLDAAIATVTGSSDVSVASYEPTSELIAQTSKSVALFVGAFGDSELTDLAVLLDGEPVAVQQAVASTLDSSRLTTLWGVPERMALADSSLVDEVISDVQAQTTANAPIVSLAASESTISAGAGVRLSWSTAVADSCSATGAWSGTQPTEGIFDTANLTQSSNFVLECVGLGGLSTASVQVAVITPQSAPTTSLTAEQITLTEGSSTILHWASENATQCTAGGEWSGMKSVVGSQSTGALFATSTYTLTCSGDSGSDSRTVTVNVNPAPTPAPVVGLAVDSTAVASGESVELSWSSSNSNACVASGAWSGNYLPSGTASVGPLTSTSTFVLTCTGSGGSSAATITVFVGPNQTPAPTVALSASPTNIIAGETSVLTWTSNDAQSCTASGAWNGVRSSNGNATSPPLHVTSNFVLTCTGDGGSTSRSVTVVVEPPEAPTLQLSASEVLLASGTTTTLNWSSTDSDSCTASGGWTGTQALNGSAVVGPITAQQTFSLACSGLGGDVVSSVVVGVMPELTLSASPTTVTLGDSTQITWASSNVDSCNASGAWSGNQAVSGSQTLSLSASGNVTLNCQGPGGVVSETVTITVNAPQPPPSINLQVTDGIVVNGGGTSLSWTTQNASSCSASGGWLDAQAIAGSIGIGPLTQPTTYTLTCTGVSGSATASVTVNILPQLAISASPATITEGDSTQVNWTASNVSSCSASDGWSGSKGSTGSESVGPLSANTQFVLNCTGPGGAVSASTTVQVDPAPNAPIVSLQPAQSSIGAGSATVLTWSSTDTDSCTASGAWSGARAVSGSASTGNLSDDANFTLACSGPGGNASVTATVNTVPAPTLSMQAAETSIAVGSSTVLTWNSTDATSCVASGAWSGSRVMSGSESTGVLNADAVYTLNCTGIAGAVSANAFVAAVALPSVSISAAPSNVTAGETTVVTWNASNADSCFANGGWSGTRSTSGSQTTPVLSGDTTFGIVCSNNVGTDTASVTVQVGPAPQPTVTLTATETVVDSGDVTQLSWSSTDTTSCTASGDWSGSKSTDGNETVGPLTQSSTYSLNCAGDGGNAVSIITIEVNGVLTLSWVAPTENVDGSPVEALVSYEIYYGDSSGNYTEQATVVDPNATSVSLPLPIGTYYLVMTATDGGGDESGYSNEVIKSSE